MKSGPARPPVLTRRRLAARLRDLQPDWPLELTRAAVEEIILTLADALAKGRSVALNGFGRFEARRYAGPRKKVGLVFRPGARLRARIQAVLAVLLCLAALAAPPAWAQEEDDDFPFWIPEMEADFQDPAPVAPRDPDLPPALIPDPEPVVQRDPGYPPDPPPSLENLIQDPDLPALVLDPDPSPETLDPSESAPEGEVDLSAPGMTGSSGGTIPIMLVEAAYLAHRKGDYQAAIDGYTRIIRRRGLTRRERAVTYLLRGEARRDAGQPDEAILDFTRALRQWPGYPSAHYFRGRVYERQSRLNDAYADLAMAVQLDPAREAYQTSLALLKLKLKEAGLLSDGPPPRPVEPHLPGE